MATVNFLLQSKKNPSPIYVRVRDRNFDAKGKTNLYIDPENWSEKKRQPKNLKDADGKYIQSKLSEIEAKVINAFNKVDQNTILDSQWISRIISNEKEKNVKLLFLEYFDLYIKDKETTGSTFLMIRRYKTIKNLISKFEASLKRKIFLKDVDIKYAEEFGRYLAKHNYKQSYIFRLTKHLKTVCYHAKAEGYETSDNFELIKSKDKKAYKIYLSLDEIKTIEETKMPTESLDNARDWLVISCFLGQRVSDFMRCNKSLIREINGNQFIDLTQKKTKKEMMISILPPVQKILEKRNGDFPRPISDQRYNEYIKEVCKIAGLDGLTQGSIYDASLQRDVDGKYEKWKLISSHVGRRSFATNYHGKMPTTLLMFQTGHTTEKSFLEYIGKGKVDQAEMFINEVLRLKLY